MTRRSLRETCFKILFCINFYPPEEIDDEIEQYFDDQTEFTDEEKEEVRNRVRLISEKVPEIDEKLKSITEGWKLERVGKVELSLLRLAVFEMLYDEEVPEKVAINEAIELARKYSGDDAPSFINGVLAKLV